MDYLSLTSCIKNEERYIQEWLCYYKSIGVEKFYIYNNESTDLTEKKIDELSFRKDITLINFKTDNPSVQGLAFQRAREHYGKKTEWMIFCDGDEFFMPTEPTDLKVFLQQYEEFSGLGVPWKMFGSSGYTTRPIQSHGCNALGSFFKCQKQPSNHIKSIVKPSEVIKPTSPHCFKTIKGTVLETKDFIKEEEHGVIRDMSISIDSIRVNHYITRSLEDWKIKSLKPYWDKGNKRAEKFKFFDFSDSIDQLSLKYIENTSKFLNI